MLQQVTGWVVPALMSLMTAGIGWAVKNTSEVPAISEKLADHSRVLNELFKDVTQLKVDEATVKTNVEAHTRALDASVGTQSSLAASQNELANQTRDLETKMDKVVNWQQINDRKIDAIDRKTDALTDRLGADENNHFRAGPGH